MNKHLSKIVLVPMIVLFLGNCGVNNVVIEGQFPTPNISKMPVYVAVIYDQALRDFSYLEYTETGSEEFNIQSGASHVELFNSITPAMFEQVIFVDTLEEAQIAGVDAIFAPAIEEFQLALPAKTKLDVYEVWIKYNMRLLTAQGDYIADWVLTSYGKTPTESFQTVEGAINDAAVIALRDLASSFSLSFSDVHEVRDWLDQQ